MKLNALEIKNYRGFESYKISFTPRTSIIIGRNGAGKSTLIDALKIALSFIFSNNKKLGKDFLSAGNPSLNVNSFTDSDYHSVLFQNCAVLLKRKIHDRHDLRSARHPRDLYRHVGAAQDRRLEGKRC